MTTPAGRPEPRRSLVVPIVFTAVGVGVCGLAYAVDTGYLQGVGVQWPAYIVGGMAILFGLKGFFAAPDPEPPAFSPEPGPLRESGRDEADVRAGGIRGKWQGDGPPYGSWPPADPPPG